MIISLEHRFIFAAIPKTGTHAVRVALREHMGAQDMEQVGLFVQRKLPIPELAQIRHGHLTLQQIRRHLSAEDFDGAFKFAFVRNPFDRFVSIAPLSHAPKDISSAIPRPSCAALPKQPPARHILFQPQNAFVTDPDGKLLSDDLGRVEEMQQLTIASRSGSDSVAAA